MKKRVLCFAMALCILLGAATALADVVDVSPNGGGSVSVEYTDATNGQNQSTTEGNTYSPDNDTDVTLTATANGGFDFDFWALGVASVSTSNPYTYKSDGSIKDHTAHFKQSQGQGAVPAASNSPSDSGSFESVMSSGVMFHRPRADDRGYAGATFVRAREGVGITVPDCPVAMTWNTREDSKGRTYNPGDTYIVPKLKGDLYLVLLASLGYEPVPTGELTEKQRQAQAKKVVEEHVRELLKTESEHLSEAGAGMPTVLVEMVEKLLTPEQREKLFLNAKGAKLYNMIADILLQMKDEIAGSLWVSWGNMRMGILVIKYQRQMELQDIATRTAEEEEELKQIEKDIAALQ